MIYSIASPRNLNRNKNYDETICVNSAYMCSGNKVQFIVPSDFVLRASVTKNKQSPQYISCILNPTFVL